MDCVNGEKPRLAGVVGGATVAQCYITSGRKANACLE